MKNFPGVKGMPGACLRPLTSLKQLICQEKVKSSFPEEHSTMSEINMGFGALGYTCDKFTLCKSPEI